MIYFVEYRTVPAQVLTQVSDPQEMSLNINVSSFIRCIIFVRDQHHAVVNRIGQCAQKDTC